MNRSGRWRTTLGVLAAAVLGVTGLTAPAAEASPAACGPRLKAYGDFSIPLTARLRGRTLTQPLALQPGLRFVDFGGHWTIVSSVQEHPVMVARDDHLRPMRKLPDPVRGVLKLPQILTTPTQITRMTNTSPSGTTSSR